VEEDRIYIGAIEDGGLSSFGAVNCLDGAAHRPRWKFTDDGRMLHMYSSPCVASGRLYISEGMHANNACKHAELFEVVLAGATTGRLARLLNGRQE